MNIIVKNIKKQLTQPACDVPGMSPESRLKVLRSGTSRGFSGDSKRTNTNVVDLMKKCFLDAIVLALHIYYSICYYWKNKYSVVLNGDVHGTSSGPLRDPVVELCRD